jgi:hypothetical protein
MQQWSLEITQDHTLAETSGDLDIALIISTK